jgi:Ca2+-binding RTX toxin-like protein
MSHPVYGTQVKAFDIWKPTSSGWASNVNRVVVNNYAGNDSVDATGTNLGTRILGGAGDDVLYGGTWVDDIQGGDGDDVIYGGGASALNFLHGNAGNDYLAGSGGTDFMYGGDGNDTLVGNSGNDMMYGEGGKDTLRGGAGDDRLDGGRDYFVDTLYGDAGNDTFYSYKFFSKANYTPFGNFYTDDNVMDLEAGETVYTALV